MRLPNGIVGIALLVACRSAAGGASPQVCAPVADDRVAVSSSDNMAGEYHLRLVATSGAKTGSAVEGTLRLQPQSAALRYRARPGGAPDSAVAHPFYGSVDLDLKAVDAVEVGATTSSDPMQPGALVIERRVTSETPAALELTIRLGSEANRRDRQRFDGGYTALRVREASADRMAGSWASGVSSERSAGYFCAVRVGGR